jgi:hypothetical protein
MFNNVLTDTCSDESTQARAKDYSRVFRFQDRPLIRALFREEHRAWEFESIFK